MAQNPRNAQAFVALMTAAGLGSVSFGLSQTRTWHPYLTLALLAIAAPASRMKIKLPGFAGNMSVNLPFLLIAVAQLNLIEALLVACGSTFVQCLPKDWLAPKLEHLVFNLATMSLATGLAWKVFHSGTLSNSGISNALLLPLAAGVFFLGQTVPVSIIISLTGIRTVRDLWTEMAQLTFPYFVLSAGVASMAMAASNQIAWQIPLVVLPVMFGVFHSYQMYLPSEEAREIPGETAPTPLSKAACAGR